MKLNSIFVPLALALSLFGVGCADDTTPTPPPANECPTAIEGTPRVVAAYLARFAAAGNDDSVLDAPGPDGRTLRERGQAAADGVNVEARRASHAGNDTVRAYLAPFIAAASVPASDWLDTLPAGELSPEAVRRAGLLAQRIIRRHFDARTTSSPWVPAYEAMASQRIGAIHLVPGAPAEWYGTADAFQASWDAALLTGLDAGDSAFASAKSSGSSDADASVAAVTAVLSANAATFATIGASTYAEAGLIADMD